MVENEINPKRKRTKRIRKAKKETRKVIIKVIEIVVDLISSTHLKRVVQSVPKTLAKW
jgi:hypothetical protein